LGADRATFITGSPRGRAHLLTTGRFKTNRPVHKGDAMNSIPNAPGVYILVLYLSQTTAITFNRKSSRHSFPPGWYVYVGSARGPGGLNRRVARHQRRNADGKRMHWNVDYFRELAPIVEVWYSYTRSEQMEHEWASAVSSMHGATVPVQGFGANDCRQCCPAHFFHFTERPATSLFRSRLRDLIAQQSNVFVEFADDALTAMAVSKHMLLVEYHQHATAISHRRCHQRVVSIRCSTE
jgi:Uri superfamily endonuclease